MVSTGLPEQQEKGDETADPVAGLARNRLLLGRRLKERFDDVLDLTERRSVKRQPSGTADRDDTAGIRRHATAIGTQMTLDWLLDAVVPAPESFACAAQIGAEAAATNSISLTEVLRSTLCWRDVMIEILTAEAAQLDGAQAILDETIDALRISVDSCLVAATRHFDARAHELSQSLDQSYEAMAHQAGHDPLTGLANRSELLTQLARVIANGPGSSSQAGVLFLDLDHFKDLNDCFGHRFGDLVLVTVAQRLVGVVRPDDTPARFGGDEFVVLGTTLNSLETAALLAQRIIDAISRPLVIEGRTVQLNASIGIAMVAPYSDRPEAVLDHADAAMYLAKERGRGRFEVFPEPVGLDSLPKRPRRAY
ncbi:MAG: diguanylate cyclase domain-containing protein [Acidimicrobiales bacterium]